MAETYRTLKDSEVERLDKTINAFRKAGWSLHGSAYSHEGYVYQPIVKED